MYCLLAAMLVAGLGQGSGTQEIACPGIYGGHLQGIATDVDWNIYWSFTVALVKTNRAGELLRTVPAPSHQGDLT